MLLVPTVARAEPISVGGTWSSVNVTGSLTTEALALTPFWAGDSWDGLTKGVNYLLAASGARSHGSAGCPSRAWPCSWP